MPELTIEYTMDILPKTPGVSPRSFAVMILDEPFLPPQRSSLGWVLAELVRLELGQDRNVSKTEASMAEIGARRLDGVGGVEHLAT